MSTVATKPSGDVGVKASIKKPLASSSSSTAVSSAEPKPNAQDSFLDNPLRKRGMAEPDVESPVNLAQAYVDDPKAQDKTAWGLPKGITEFSEAQDALQRKLDTIQEDPLGAVSKLTDRTKRVPGVGRIGYGVDDLKEGKTASGAAAIGSGVLAGVALRSSSLYAWSGLGVATALDGGRQVANNWNDRSQDHKVGAGLMKTATGTAMAVGAGMMATGIGAPIGAGIFLGASAAAGVTYLSDWTGIGDSVTGALGSASYKAADMASSAYEGGKNMISNASQAAGKWLYSWVPGS